ncbi:MAG: histidine phosphatase family protein [Xanthomonadales bacterium]|nr:histidine phosphatase family protein [Xanthomonadales bacterium]
MSFSPALQAADGAVTLLVRHAEKAPDSGDPPLNDAGRLRAESLAALLRDANITRVYSTDFARTRQTARPVADSLGLEIILYDPDELDGLARKIEATAAHTLVVGHSDTIPALVEKLGGEAGPAIDEATEYDRLYILSRTPPGEATTVLLRYGEP